MGKIWEQKNAPGLGRDYNVCTLAAVTRYWDSMSRKLRSRSERLG